MHIQQSRIINTPRYLRQISGSTFQIVCNLGEVTESRKAKAGVPSSPADGDIFLPAVIGRVTRFNAEGGWTIRRDLPKEPRYIRTVFWQWKTWNGEEHSEFKDIYRDCYPRELTAPPAVELTIRNNAGRRDLLEEGHTLSDPSRVRHVNWRFLPPGRHPWDKLEDYLETVLPIRAAGAHIVIRDRQETIKGYGPSELYVGEGGFSDYIAYVFPTRNHVIFESIRRGNALYIFGNDWQSCSKLTKADVINSRVHLHRIIHTEGWKGRFGEIMAPRR